ncbi:MAG TPA: HAMP domain-containing sensor histidine kinase [Mycobacteriales bacterium]|nr:HAMP domain-containing sensor histidine kinase [Mycobacteriales bacterium]
MTRPTPARPTPAQPAAPRPGAARPTLASRIALVTTAVAVVTVLLGGVLTFSLASAAAESSARATLGRLADAARSDVGERRISRPLFLRVANVGLATFDAAGRLADSTGPAPRLALSAVEIRQVVGGASISTTRPVAGAVLLVEARPAQGGGAVVVTQRRSDARGLASPLIRRTLLALLIGLGVAVAAGILLARRLTRPLRRAAYAAHALAGGARDVRLTPEGPAEVADVAESINTLAGALEHSEARQRDFLLSVSHELRTPLTAISGFAEALADGVTTGPDVPAAGQTVLAEARRLERLVSDLLDLARLGAADFRIDVAEVDLTSLLGEAAGVWRARCEAEGVRFGAELPDRPVYARTDPTRVRQIVDGLAENALRVTPAGRPIVVGLYVDGAHAVLQVRDGGPGLTPGDCAVAFERSALYERYRGVRQVGTGLGLALVHGLTTRLGGIAQAGRAPEGGACFTVRILRTSELAQPTVPIRPPPGDLLPRQGS